MNSALSVDGFQFAFTVTVDCLFPQLTMDLALPILVLKTMALRTGDEHYNRASRFWARIFGINFVMGVVTGIPMEFQFGINWAQFSRAAGGNRSAPGDGRNLLFLPGVHLPGPVSIRRKAPGAANALVLFLVRVFQVVAFGLLYHRDRRLDAAPLGLPNGF